MSKDVSISSQGEQENEPVLDKGPWVKSQFQGEKIASGDLSFGLNCIFCDCGWYSPERSLRKSIGCSLIIHKAPFHRNCETVYDHFRIKKLAPCSSVLNAVECAFISESLCEETTQWKNDWGPEPCYCCSVSHTLLENHISYVIFGYCHTIFSRRLPPARRWQWKISFYARTGIQTE